MSAFYRRIAAAPSVIFPIRNRDFDNAFKESRCAQGVCFAFSVLFLKDEHLDISDAGCRESLIVLQQAHEEAVKTERNLLTQQDLAAYGLRFVAKYQLETLDIPTIKQTLDHWVCSNNDGPTRVLLSTAIRAVDGSIRKHFSPLMFDPKKNQWEVGDTTFALDAVHGVARNTLPPTSLALYLGWQIQYVVGYCDAGLKVTLFQVKLRK
jgi:hypothetical protein